MAVSANTLFHFTKFDTLQKILASQGFWPQYSKEHFEKALPKGSNYSISYIPMVCFCDLKLTQLSDLSISQHTAHFGNYGIGFKKDWGIKNNISPVVYIHEKSIAASTIEDVITTVNSSSVSRKNKKVIQQLGEIVKFLKPYKGSFQKGIKLQEEITYYDEREWRYIPKESTYAVDPYSKENRSIIRELNEELQTKPLRFNPNDVKYLIIDNSEDKKTISDVIQEMNIDDIDKTDLTTKIITLQEIRDDF